VALVEFGATYDIFHVGRNATAALDGGFSMVLYEVNLSVRYDLCREYLPWLKQHIEEMLQFQGFEGANLWLEESPEQNDAARYTVHYEISNRDALEAYFVEHAERMRGDGLRRFPDGVSAQRRIFTSA
jgi:hypothetical protein